MLEPKTVHERLSRDLMFMQMAELLRLRSSCNRGQVGALIVRDARIVSTGYNGAPSGAPHCTDVGCDVQHVYVEHKHPDGGYYAEPEEQELGCQRAVHAEANAIAWAARKGISTEGATLYSTHAPCLKCAQLIATCGIKVVYYQQSYRLERLDILEESGVKVEQIGWL